ncbi:ribokinase [Devosia pacifica]|uniref:Ribokinase n=1 Tax=Devosia pacifica TaxID=1335967 RepID=A0A918RTM1_9HYPH|nr:ribokinase [Devosia pacifica]GHA09983.1 ribokinase [Devosia pacifica]
MTKVAVVGSINLDVVVRLARRPEPGETVMGQWVGRFPGGKGMNQAVAAHRSGAVTRFCGQVGADPDGTFLRDALVTAGLSDADLLSDPNLPSGTAQIAALPGGENSIVVVPGANLGLSTERAVACLENAAVVLVQMEIDPGVVAAVLAAARDRGIATVLNAAPATEVGDALLSLVDVLIVNETELADLGGLERVLRRGPTHVVVTLGGDGAYCASLDARRKDVSAFVVDVLDTTGAGDAFCGVFAASIAQNLEIDEALKRASAAGAITASAMGAQDPSLSAAAIRELIDGGECA